MSLERLSEAFGENTGTGETALKPRNRLFYGERAWAVPAPVLNTGCQLTFDRDAAEYDDLAFWFIRTRLSVLPGLQFFYSCYIL